MGAVKVITFVFSFLLLCIDSGSTTHEPDYNTTMPMTTKSPMTGMMEDWKIVAIVVPVVIGGLALLMCLMCCCCCQGGAGGGGGGWMCCDPNSGGCGPMCDPNCCGPMCDPNCCGPMCDCNACCGPMCDPAVCCGPQCCGPQCCGPCCYVAPVTTAPVVTQYATRSQIWPQQACNYRSAPPGAVMSDRAVSSVQVNGPYGRSMDCNYGSGPIYGGGAQCGPCGQPAGGYRY